MRLKTLPEEKPLSVSVPKMCPYEGCESGLTGRYQEVKKRIRDTVGSEVDVAARMLGEVSARLGPI